MRIFIPTYGRANRVRTLEYIPEAILVVRPEEEAAYRRNYPRQEYLILPEWVTNVAQTRSFAFQALGGKVLAIDDDFSFWFRPDPNDTTLVKCGDHEISDMLASIRYWLDSYVHVAIAQRTGHNRLPPVQSENKRYSGMFALNMDALPDGIEWDRVPVMEDFDLQLQLLRKGYPSLTLTTWCHNQNQTQMSGGCSTYRTHEVQDAAARKLAELHPGFVKLREKRNKSGGEFGVRTDVTLYSKKAFDSAFK